MNSFLKKYRYVLVFTLFITTTFLISYLYISTKEKSLLNEIYSSLSKEIVKSTKTLIHNKKNATMAIAIPLSKNYDLVNAFSQNKFSDLKFNELSKELKDNTNYQNVWIQVINKDGFSKYRSWTNNINDEIIRVRNDLDKTFKLKVPRKVISVGSYDLAFKASVPIFNNGEFLGIVEAITKFNSISKSIKELGFDAVILTNKKDTYKLKYPFSKNFLQGYYISNVNVDKYVLSYLKTKRIDELLNINSFTIIDNYFITKVNIEDKAGSILLFKSLDSIDIKSIQDFKKQAFTILFTLFFLCIFLFIIYTYNTQNNSIKSLNKKLLKSIYKQKSQKKKIQSLLDSQSNIIIITNGEEILEANKPLLKFFTDCKDLKAFKKKYTCVCTTFVPYNDDDSYVLDLDYDGLNWAEYILSKPEKTFKAAIYNMDKELRHFALHVSQNGMDDVIIVTLTDITQDMITQEKLKDFNSTLEKLVVEKTHELVELNESLELRVKNEIQKSKEKDKVIFYQNKMSTITQMLQNIAHQWRQPLNFISTASGAILINKELNTLDDDILRKHCQMIIDKTQYLSSTIDQFDDMLLEDNSLVSVPIKDVLDSCLSCINMTLSEKFINLKVEVSSNPKITIFESDFKKALLNILDNSIEMLHSKNIHENDRVIYIKINDEKLEIEDSAGGIEDKNLERVFEPYFTTKHQAQGVGLGLYLVKEILTTQMDFKIDIKNINFEFNNKIQKGLRFTIYLK